MTRMRVADIKECRVRVRDQSLIAIYVKTAGAGDSEMAAGADDREDRWTLTEYTTSEGEVRVLAPVLSCSTIDIRGGEWIGNVHRFY